MSYLCSEHLHIDTAKLKVIGLKEPVNQGLLHKKRLCVGGNKLIFGTESFLTLQSQ